MTEQDVEDPESDRYWIPPSDDEPGLLGTLWRVA
jgi:hypothetical protein